jgi:subtilisin family serine protease
MRASRALLVGLTSLGLLAGMVPAAQADTGTDTYVVQFKNTISASAVTPSLLGGDARALNHVHAAVAKLSAAKAAALARNPNVKSVRKSSRIKATGQETNAPWDLDVLDSRAGVTDTTYTYPNTGTGVTVYVIDSGLTPTHAEFASAHILPGINFVQASDPATSCGKNRPADTTVDPADTLDQAGHGTAVSSLVVGAKYGVAKDATIVPVRILDCDGGGNTPDVTSAVDWIIGQHAADGTPAVVNMSFGADFVAADLDAAAQSLIDAGITVVVAAGNSNMDACTTSPARVPAAITAAAVTSALVEPAWPNGQSTNWGSCVDMYAPGAGVVVAKWDTPAGGAYADGTSFSSPLIAGGAAQVLADHPTWSPAQVAADLSSRATYGVVTGARSVNKLLDVGPIGTFDGTAPTISPLVRVGDLATSTLHWTPVPTTVTYQWYLDGNEIPGATAATYRAVDTDQGSSLTVTVVGSYPGYADVTGDSAPVVVTPPPSPGLVIPLAPARILDTRFGIGGTTGPLYLNQTVTLPVQGKSGVSETAKAVLVNITCTEPTANGYVTGHASQTPAPFVSSANFTAYRNSGNLALVPVGVDGAIAFTIGIVPGAHVQIVVDLQGYVAGGGEATEAGAVVPIEPSRLVDTRKSTPVQPFGTLDVPVAGILNVPADATAVLIHVTVTDPTGSGGYLTVYPKGEDRPYTANLNFLPGQTIPNLVVAKVGAAGSVSIYNFNTGTSQVVVDIQGYVTGGTATATGAIVPITPARVLDTRIGLGAPTGTVAAGAERVVTFTGQGGVASASGVIMNLTVTQPKGTGYLIAYPTSGVRPFVSNLNFDPGDTVPNLVSVGLTGGTATLYNGPAGGGSAHIVADVMAYIL